MQKTVTITKKDMEFDSLHLISYLSRKSVNDNVVINIKEMRELGRVIESLKPSISIDMDKYSIESFCIKAKGSAIIVDGEICFNRTDRNVSDILRRYDSPVFNSILSFFKRNNLVDSKISHNFAPSNN